MSLPPDTNERIARMEGWNKAKGGKFGGGWDWQAPDGGVLCDNCPDYRHSLDAIEPILTKRLPHWAADHHWADVGIHVYTVYPNGTLEVQFQDADTLAEAMCAAVLATEKTQ